MVPGFLPYRLPAPKCRPQYVVVLDEHSSWRIIVAAIIGLAHNLRLRVIAEGVENEDQMAYLREKGCDEVQGFFSRPLPRDEFTDLLKNAGRLPNDSER